MAAATWPIVVVGQEPQVVQAVPEPDGARQLAGQRGAYRGEARAGHRPSSR